MTDQYLKLQLVGLAFRTVPSGNGNVRMRAASWHNLLHKLGIHLPYVVVHDLGQLLCLEDSQRGEVGLEEEALDAVGAGREVRGYLKSYQALMVQVSKSEVIRRARAWKLGDDVVAVLMAKILMLVNKEWPNGRKTHYIREQLAVDADEFEQPYLRHHLMQDDWDYYTSFFATLAAKSLQVRHAVEQIDLDTLRLLSMFGGTEFGNTPLELVDLMGLFTMPMVNDIVNFSLQILPSVLQSKKLKDAQTFSMDGFSGVERVGNLDNLVLSEFAYDEDIFYQKFLENELYYYGRDRAREEEQKVHYLAIDSSASMRGRRTVFARGVALAMLKKLVLQQEHPRFRFFDSRLYDTVSVGVDAHSVPYLLSFQSERGRNYGKVFEELLYDCRRIREREKREVILYFFTHGQCHLPSDLVLRLREFVHLFGVFILPGPKLELSYVADLHHHQVVTEESLISKESRSRAAHNILSRINE